MSSAHAYIHTYTCGRFDKTCQTLRITRKYSSITGTFIFIIVVLVEYGQIRYE